MNSIRFLAVAGLLACSASGADFFPLETGNTWTYREARTGQTFTVRVGLPLSLNERVYYSLQGYVDSQQLVRVDERGRLVYLDAEKASELPLTSFEPFEAGWWDSPLRLCAQWGQTLEKRGVHDGPAGPFRDVLGVRYRTLSCADAGVQSEQYAENIGMVRRVENSFIGPWTFDLVSARVGNLRIHPALSGQFRVSVEPGLNQLAITIALETPSEQTLKLPFASGQEYDVVLRDSEGRVAWKWSVDQMFTMSLHERSVSGSWSVTLNAPRPQAGDYVVHAWLTTMGDAPLFAATAPVTVK